MKVTNTNKSEDIEEFLEVQTYEDFPSDEETTESNMVSRRRVVLLDSVVDNALNRAKNSNGLLRAQENLSLAQLRAQKTDRGTPKWRT